jgi:hypothetical protein
VSSLGLIEIRSLQLERRTASGGSLDERHFADSLHESQRLGRFGKCHLQAVRFRTNLIPATRPIVAEVKPLTEPMGQEAANISTG